MSCGSIGMTLVYEEYGGAGFDEDVILDGIKEHPNAARTRVHQ